MAVLKGSLIFCLHLHRILLQHAVVVDVCTALQVKEFQLIESLAHLDFFLSLHYIRVVDDVVRQMPVATCIRAQNKVIIVVIVLNLDVELVAQQLVLIASLLQMRNRPQSHAAARQCCRVHNALIFLLCCALDCWTLSVPEASRVVRVRVGDGEQELLLASVFRLVSPRALVGAASVHWDAQTFTHAHEAIGDVDLVERSVLLRELGLVKRVRLFDRKNFSAVRSRPQRSLRWLLVLMCARKALIRNRLHPD